MLGTMGCITKVLTLFNSPEVSRGRVKIIRLYSAEEVDIVSVIRLAEEYTVKYSLSTSEIPRAEPKGFPFHWTLDTADGNVTTIEQLPSKGCASRQMWKHCIVPGNLRGLSGEFLFYET